MNLKLIIEAVREAEEQKTLLVKDVLATKIGRHIGYCTIGWLCKRQGFSDADLFALGGGTSMSPMNGAELYVHYRETLESVYGIGEPQREVISNINDLKDVTNWSDIIERLEKLENAR